MRLPRLVGGMFVAALALGTFAVAADPEKPKTVRRDPEGKKGISPYNELIVKGETAFVARDVPGAIAAFQQAIKLDAEKMLGYARLAEVQMDQGKLDEANALLDTAIGKKGPDELRAKVLFLTAALRERQQKWQAAKDAWAAYAAFLAGNPKVRGFASTATERMKQADRRMHDEVVGAEIKERIAKRIAEKEAEAAENAKKDKLNR